MNGTDCVKCAKRFLRLALTWPLWWVRERRRKRELRAYLQDVYAQWLEKCWLEPDPKKSWNWRYVPREKPAAVAPDGPNAPRALHGGGQ